jgi:hypothetical protein
MTILSILIILLVSVFATFRLFDVGSIESVYRYELSNKDAPKAYFDNSLIELYFRVESQDSQFCKKYDE